MKNKLFLTESEKSRISSLHRRAIVTESKNTLNEATLADIQNLLKDKGLDLGPKGADGKLGPFTLNAIYSALTQSQGGGNTNQQPAAETQQPAAGTQQPAAGTQQPAAGTQQTATPAGTENVLKVGNVYEGTSGDNAQGQVLKVLSITPIPGCDVKEVALKMTQGAGYTLYGYLQGTDLSASSMRRSRGDATKSENPCEEIKKDMISFGTLEPEGTMKKMGLK